MALIQLGSLGMAVARRTVTALSKLVNHPLAYWRPLEQESKQSNTLSTFMFSLELSVGQVLAPPLHRHWSTSLCLSSIPGQKFMCLPHPTSPLPSLQITPTLQVQVHCSSKIFLLVTAHNATPCWQWHHLPHQQWYPPRDPRTRMRRFCSAM